LRSEGLDQTGAQRPGLRFVGTVEQVEPEFRIGLVDRPADLLSGGLHCTGALRDA
jgi:hypothetical protein